MSGTIVQYYAYNIPGSKPVPKPLVVRVFDNREYYWNYSKNKWVRLTSRCPLL